MKVVVDFDRCASNAMCMEIAPEIFHVNDANELDVLLPEPPEELREKAREAAAECPMRAITIVD